ncbi:hypothetical protein jhhlp_002732 [Lomentospora prolificans]|uniref:Uncharacterized protein n=1 Tax=Lomentospora prolificans TaxID=41688 RepID=A0A2N3NEV8_9PEZI|nr:hypothetical protein jhhlp_002732 [Lomentospora prolificans]
MSFCTVAAIASQGTPTANKRFSTGGFPSPTRSPQESPDLSPRLRRASTLKLPIKISTDPSFSSRSSAARSRTRSLTAISPEDNPIRPPVQFPPSVLESPPLLETFSGTLPETPIADNTSDRPAPLRPNRRPSSPPPPPKDNPLPQPPRQREEAASTARAPSRQATTIPTSTPEKKSPAPARKPSSRPVSPELPRAPRQPRVEETKPASARPVQQEYREEERQPQQQRFAPPPTMSSPAKNPQLAMDTAQAYTQGNSQAANRGPIANLPLPNLSGQANGVIGKSSLSSPIDHSLPVEDGGTSAPLQPRPPSNKSSDGKTTEEPESTSQESLSQEALERIAAQSPPSNLLKGPVGADGKLKDAALMVGIKLDLEAEVHLTARVRGDILVGLY